jgi:hypothetical protein
MPTLKLGLPLISENMNANVPRDLNALAQAIDAKAGVAGGLATLDENGNVNGIDTSNLATKQEVNTVSQTVSTHSSDGTAHGIGDKTTLKTTDKTSIVAALNELFTNANNGKSDIASVIGSPATSIDTFAQLKTHIQNSKNTLAETLSNYNKPSTASESLESLTNKVIGLGLSITPGDDMYIGVSEEQVSLSSSTYVKVKEIKVNVSGTVRTRFTLRANTQSGDAYATIYINGIAVGTERSNGSSNPIIFTEDLSVNKGDLVQLYGRSSSTYYSGNVAGFSLGIANTDYAERIL